MHVAQMHVAEMHVMQVMAASTAVQIWGQAHRVKGWLRAGPWVGLQWVLSRQQTMLALPRPRQVYNAAYVVAQSDLDVVLVQGLVQVVDVNIAVQRITGCALHQTLNLSPTEVASELSEPLQIHVVAQEGVGAHLQQHS